MGIVYEYQSNSFFWVTYMDSYALLKLQYIHANMYLNGKISTKSANMQFKYKKHLEQTFFWPFADISKTLCDPFIENFKLIIVIKKLY